MNVLLLIFQYERYNIYINVRSPEDPENAIPETNAKNGRDIEKPIIR